MKGKTEQYYGSSFWENPQLINAYCDEKVAMLLKHVDTIFEDVMDLIGQGVLRCAIPITANLY